MKSPYNKNTTSSAAAARPALEPFIRMEGESMEQFEARAKARILELHAQEAADCAAHRAKMADLDKKMAEFDAKKALLDQAMAEMEANASKENIEKVRQVAADLFKKEQPSKADAPKTTSTPKTEAPKKVEEPKQEQPKQEAPKAATQSKSTQDGELATKIGKAVLYTAGAVAVGVGGYFAWKRWGSN